MEFLRVILDSWQGKVTFAVALAWFIWTALRPVYDWAKPEAFEWIDRWNECPCAKKK